MLGYIISDKEEINVENYKIKSFDILHKTHLNIFVIKNNKLLYKNNIINYTSLNGHVEVLEWFKNSGYEFKYDKNAIENAIDYASLYGHIQVLEWFKNSGYEFNYDNDAINYASYYGHVQVLEWFKNSGYEFKYNEDAIDYSSQYGHIKILKWFKKSDYKFKYSKYGIYNVSEYKHRKILKFYCNKINIKKIINWSNKIIFIKTIKFKTNNKYLKGYQKN